MPKLKGMQLGAQSITCVFRNPATFSTLAVGWALFVTFVVALMAILVALGERTTLAAVIVRMQTGDLQRPHTTISNLAAVFGQLAVAIGWSRLVLLSERPHLTAHMPRGSGRYFGRSLLLGLGWVLLLIPGVVMGALVGRFVPSPFGPVAAAIIMAAGGLAAVYLCLRAWLVFPAIAIGNDDLTFRQSVALTKGASMAIILGTVISYLPFVIIALVVEVVLAIVPEGMPYAVASMVAEFATTLAIYGGVAATAGVMAVIYRATVPGAPPVAEQVAVFD